MKKVNKSAFDIEMSSIRELNSDEINQVGGGWITLPVLVSIALSCLGTAVCGDENQQQ